MSNKDTFSPMLKEDEGSVMLGNTEYFFQVSYVNNITIINWFNKPKNNEEIEKKIQRELKKNKNGR